MSYFSLIDPMNSARVCFRVLCQKHYSLKTITYRYPVPKSSPLTRPSLGLVSLGNLPATFFPGKWRKINQAPGKLGLSSQHLAYVL